MIQIGDARSPGYTGEERLLTLSCIKMEDVALLQFCTAYSLVAPEAFSSFQDPAGSERENIVGP
jgi:hypothetical protein